MDYIDSLIAVIALIFGLFANRFLPSYMTKKGEHLATREDIGKITEEIKKVENLFKNQYDLSKTEREFYNEMVKTIYKFLAKIKKYETDHPIEDLNSETMKKDLKQDFREFVDATDEFVARSYVFLKEENFNNLREGLDTNGSFADLAKNLLYAMRKSLHPETKLTPKENLKEFNY